jgi:hypothetical protein
MCGRFTLTWDEWRRVADLQSRGITSLRGRRIESMTPHGAEKRSTICSDVRLA